MCAFPYSVHPVDAETCDHIRRGARATRHPVPTNVLIEMTAGCNHRCGYCLAADRGTEPLDPAKVLSIVAEVAALGPVNVALTGGEPTLSPDALEACHDCLSQNGIAVSLVTHGDMPDGVRHRVMARPWDWMQVTMDSLDESLNDALRGKCGAWEGALRTLLEFSDRSDVELRMKQILTPRTWRDADDVVALAALLGIRTVQFDFAATWSANASADTFRLSPGERAASHARIRDLGRIWRRLVDVVPPWPTRTWMLHNCLTATDSAVVLADGDVRVPFLPITFGNAAREGFAAVWDRMTGVWQRADVIAGILAMADTDDDMERLRGRLENGALDGECGRFDIRDPYAGTCGGGWDGAPVAASEWARLLAKPRLAGILMPWLLEQRWRPAPLSLRPDGDGLVVRTVHAEDGSDIRDSAVRLDAMQERVFHRCLEGSGLRELLGRSDPGSRAGRDRACVLLAFIRTLQRKGILRPVVEAVGRRAQRLSA